jgi:predicted lipid-binding transport protein (Tim44 family)
MNHAKIAAALHALAEAFEGVVEDVEKVVKPAKGKAKAAAEPAASAQAAPSTVAAEPVAAEPTPAPVPSITKAQLNAVVLKVAAKSRDTAEAILGKFGAKNTVTLAPELWQTVFDAFEEEIAKQDAAAVQVQQASLV